MGRSHRPLAARLGAPISHNRPDRFEPIRFPSNLAQVQLGVPEAPAFTEPSCIIEPDLQKLKTFLQRLDVTEELRTGRLCLASPVLATDALAQVSLAELSAALSTVTDPLTWQINRPANENEISFFRRLQQSVELITQVSERVQGWPTSNSTPHRLTVVSPQCAIFDDLAECFKALGVETQLFRIPDRAQQWSRTRWLHALRQLREQPADAILMRNRVLFDSVQPGERYGLERFLPGRAILWWWDVPHVLSRIEMGCPLPGAMETVTHAFARELAEQLNSKWLPPGARTEFVRAAGQPLTAPEMKVSFVGQSRYDALMQNLQMLVDGMVSVGGHAGRALANAFASISLLEKLHAQFERCTADWLALKDKLARQIPACAYFLHYLFEMCRTATFRLQAIATLSQVPVTVFGDPGWLKAGVVKPEHFRGLVSPAQLPEIYRSSRLNLNLNFMQVSSTVNPKVLDILACGAVVLTDHRPELAELFPDPAVRPVSFRSLKELPQRVSEALAAGLTPQLTAYVHQHHTLSHRASQLLKTLL